MSTINRSETCRALAKATAYADCGQQAKAEDWARKLVEHLQCAGILR